MTGRRRAATAALAFTGLALAGCGTLGPKYQRPELPLPAAYSDAGAPGVAAADAWWTLFGAPELDRLVEEALAANQDLAAAAARVEEARALAGLARAERFPDIEVEASGSRTKLSSDTAQLPPGFDLELDRYRATANFSFELDFWGKLARASEALRAELLASEEGRRNVRLAIVAETVTAYFDHAAFARQLAIATGTLDSRDESRRLQQARFDAGTISELELAQAQAELAATAATVPALARLLRQTENRLGVLLGRIGRAAPADGNQTSPLDALTPPAVPVGLPSELLLRRPDIAEAEQRLVAAHARIAVVRAEYFPVISLTGYAGSESKELSNLFAAGTGLWRAALGLVQPLFDIPKTRRQVEAAKAREDQALAAYRKSVQSAFAEVEDALIGRSTGAAEREALARQVEALTRARRLAGLRYEAGESSYFEVLDAERNLFRAELELARAQRAELVAAVGLFKAIGGGWAEPGE